MANTDIVPFDFDQNKTTIVSKFAEKGYDATYEGSNAALLADVLAYVVSMLNVNTAANIGEMLLTKARQRKSIMYLAREQGYEAQNKVSYEYRLTLIAKVDSNLPDDDTTLRVYEIPKYFSIQNGSKSYYYFGNTLTRQLSNSMINDVNNTDKYFTIVVKEGTLYLQKDYPDILTIYTPTTLDSSGNIVADTKINIPYTNVEDNGIELYLTYVDADGIQHLEEPWYKSTQFLTDKDSNLKYKFIRLDDIELGTPKLYFSIAGVGNQLRLNTIIKANILVSSGSAGAKVGAWNITNTNINTNFVLYTGNASELVETLVTIGNDEESATSVQQNAPLFHNSANRAVTKYDYVSICNRFANVRYTQCWGGDEELPMKLGHIYLSMIPEYIPSTWTNDDLKYNFDLVDKDNPDLLFMKPTELVSSTYDENNNLLNPGVFDVLNDYKIMTTQLHNVNPFYMDFEYALNIVRYSLSNTKQVTHQDIFNIIKNYFDSYINNFEKQYFHSNLVKRMDTELIDLSGLNSVLNTKICIYGRYKDGSASWTNYNLYEYFTSKRTEMGITFYLGMPFENIYTGIGDIIPGILPDISTNDFLNTGDEIFVDWTDITLPVGAGTPRDADNYYFSIKYYDGVETKICGRYFVQNSVKAYIKVDLYVNEDGSIPEDPLFMETPLTNIMFNVDDYGARRLNCKYNSYNLRMFKHMFPRFTKLTFS